MDDDGATENIHGTKRPRRDTSASDGLSTEAAVLTPEGGGAPAAAGEDPPQPRDAQLRPPQQSGRGGGAGGRKRDGRSFSNDVRAYSGISPLPQQHSRLSNNDLPGCIVRQDFHCAVLSDAVGQPGVEQCLSFHPNGLAVVQLAPTHPAVGSGDSAIVAADFDAGGCNVLESAVVTGKKKKGALQLHPTTILCSVTTKGGEQYKVCTGISGELIQANKTLADNPGLMSDDPLGRGWVAIVRLKPRDLRRLQEALGVVEER